MLPNRKLRIGGGVFFITLALLALYYIPDKTVNYWVGILFGGVAGGATIVYMMLNNLVDPEQAKRTYRERVNSPWIIISVVGGSILGRVIIQRLSSTNLDVLFLSFLLTWNILFWSYFSFKIWKSPE